MQISNVLKLFERSMGSLMSVTRSSFGPDRENDSRRVQVKDVEYIPLVEQGMIQVKANTFSSMGGSPYQTIIVLNNMQYINEETFDSASPDMLNFTSADGTEYYVQSPQNRKSDAKVRCTCEDFRWRFAAYNDGDQSLQGDPPDAYIKTTDRPSVNPSNTPGVCKHLIKLKNEIERENFFRSLLN